MKQASAEVVLVTPCISSGADQKKAEIRAQSIRGLLHYWFRALGGKLKEENCVFGCIGKQEDIRRSSLNVRIRVPDDLRVSLKNGKELAGHDYDYFLWPMRGKKGSPNSGARGIIEPDQSFELRISHSRISGGSNLPEKALKATLLLGSLGTRSRRCYGSIWPKSITIDGSTRIISTNPDDISAELQELLEGTNINILRWGDPKKNWSQAVQCAASTLKAFRCGSSKSGTPSLWGQNDHDVPLKNGSTMYRPALGLPLTQRYSNKRTSSTTFEGNDRWASPLLLKVIPWGNEYQAIAIFINDYVITDGERLSVRGNAGSASPILSHDLWLAMQDPNEETYKNKADILV